MITKIDINDTNSSGYLGNQLFMYAAMIGYAKKHFGSLWKMGVYIPEWDVDRYLKNPIKSDLPAGMSIPKDVTDYIERSFSYLPIPYCHKIVNISGYFQSYKYFENAELEIRESMEFTEEVKKSALSKKYTNGLGYQDCTFDDLFYNERVISIQYRSGDYKNFPNHFAQLAQTSYYKDAFDLIVTSDSYNVEKFLVFSNNIEEAKSIFNWSNKFIFCESFQEKSEGNSSQIEDLFLMSRCDHNIIANSSFSWWGAWLNQNEDKKVIAPKNWFGPALFMNDTKDMLPLDWIKL